MWKFNREAKGGREIERSQYEAAVEQNTRNYKLNQKLYRRRQYSSTMLNYNINRTLNILDFDNLMNTLKIWKPKYRQAWHLRSNPAPNAAITLPIFYELEIAA